MPTAQEKSIMAAWQQKLIDAGYSLAPYGADGLGGTTTQKAIQAFQRDHNLPITGQFDQATMTALNPPQFPAVSAPLVTMAGEAIIDLALPPSPAKDYILMAFPTVVTQLIGQLPAIPDDFSIVLAEIHEQASSDPEVAKVRSAAIFARRLADACDQVANTLDPTGKIQPSVTIPPSYAGATSPSTATVPAAAPTT